jgi:hypothetical protein
MANTLAAIKMAKYYNMNGNDAIITVATDPAWMYLTFVISHFVKPDAQNRRVDAQNRRETRSTYRGADRGG